MPQFADLGLHVSSIADPRHYPGTTVRTDCLVAAPWLYRVVPTGDDVGDWSVRVDGGPAAEAGLTGAPDVSDALDALRVTPMRDRVPVLSVGSNAAPAQLARKFAGHGVPEVLPITVVTAGNLRVGHSAHVSAPGYVPYAPMYAPGATTRLVVLWLDPPQLERISATEPNYDLVPLAAADVPVQLGTGTEVKGAVVYRTRRGLLRKEPGGPPRQATTQQWVYSQLAAAPWFVRLVPEYARGLAAAMAGLADDAVRRSVVGRALAEARLVSPDALPVR